MAKPNRLLLILSLQSRMTRLRRPMNNQRQINPQPTHPQMEVQRKTEDHPNSPPHLLPRLPKATRYPIQYLIRYPRTPNLSRTVILQPFRRMPHPIKP
jgi:hypothetical protein